jgi:uncharacterized protein DUF4240
VDDDTFWGIIETARADAGPDTSFADALVEELATRSVREVRDFHERFFELHTSLYRWDIWAAAYLIGGGCSDDSFSYFRAGVIGQGREWYQRVLASPDSLADHPAALSPRNGRLFYEEISYAADYAIERITGTEEHIGYAGPREGDQDMGEDFDFDDPREMHRRLPRLAALCLGDQQDGSVIEVDGPFYRVKAAGFEMTIPQWEGADADTADEADATIILPDGSRRYATFMTLGVIQRVMDHWRTTGECGSGKYFWCSDLIVIREPGIPAMTDAVADLIATGELADACGDIPFPDDDDGDDR